MRKTSLFIFFFILIAVNTSVAGNLGMKKAKPQSKVFWHSYIQLEANTAFENSYYIGIHRLKFWLGSTPAFSQHWSYKVQVLFATQKKEKLFLQDAYGKYRNKSGVSIIQFGQFVPKFSLQRFQPDYLIPSVNRANVINAVIPDGTMGVRDIGVQYNLKPDHKKLEINFGFFNGYGIKVYHFSNKGYLLTQNLSYTIPGKKSQWKFGYSVMYRKAFDLPLKNILPDSVLFSGNDFRIDLYGLFNSRYLNVQAEYLRAWLNSNPADGYYVLTTIKPSQKNHIYLSYDKYNDLIDSTNNKPWYVIGYNYLINKFNLMVTLDTRFRDDGGRMKNVTSLQFQMFLH